MLIPYLLMGSMFWKMWLYWHQLMQHTRHRYWKHCCYSTTAHRQLHRFRHWPSPRMTLMCPLEQTQTRYWSPEQVLTHTSWPNWWTTYWQTAHQKHTSDSRTDVHASNCRHAKASLSKAVQLLNLVARLRRKWPLCSLPRSGWLSWQRGWLCPQKSANSGIRYKDQYTWLAQACSVVGFAHLCMCNSDI